MKNPGGHPPRPPVPRWSTLEGSPVPQGVVRVEEEEAFNFAVYSKHAATVTLLLFRAEDLEQPHVSYRMDFRRHKTGRIWHCRIPFSVVEDCCYYAYLAEGEGPETSRGWQRFDGEKVLFDPYARELFFPPDFSRAAASAPGSNMGRAPLGVLPLEGTESEPRSNGKPPRHEGDAVIYELHVDGFTRSESSGLPPDRRGTFQGLIDRIPYLQELGVTVVELMPVFQLDPQEGSYWGYMPISFFAVNAGYASNSELGGPREEFRDLVAALHRAGIEVVLDVVYNHTGEGDHRGPTYSLKGLDNTTFYLMGPDPESPYANFSGTGNTLHTANYYVRKMVLDSLRYWVLEMGVDGFRFDLASIFARGRDGSVDESVPGIFAEIASDPVLSRVRLIAEPWDAAGAYLLGRGLPGITWAQWNSRFEEDVRRFVRGDPGATEGLMRRLYGSDDLFPDDRMHAYRPQQSVNYVTSHDGFTLYDVTAYTERRNWANGYGNQDGAAENFSSNCGWEGDDNVPEAVVALRKRRARLFACLLLLANGVPMIRAGDEFLQTQGGNNNPHNQNNPTTWLDWTRLETHTDVHRFFREMIAFRKRHPTIPRGRFWRDDVRWFSPRGGPAETGQPRLAYLLRDGEMDDVDLYVMINGADDACDFVLPEAPAGGWARAVDTGLETPDDIVPAGEEVRLEGGVYRLGGSAAAVLVSLPADR